MEQKRVVAASWVLVKRLRILEPHCIRTLKLESKSEVSGPTRRILYRQFRLHTHPFLMARIQKLGNLVVQLAQSRRDLATGRERVECPTFRRFVILVDVV